MPIAMAAKLSFGVAALILWQTGRTPFQLWLITTPDLILVVLFFAFDLHLAVRVSRLPQVAQQIGRQRLTDR